MSPPTGDALGGGRESTESLDASPRPAEESSDVGADARRVEWDLVSRMKRGDDDAFSECVRLHGARMLAVARRYLPAECDAEDALQDALLSAFRNIGGFARESRLSTWLHRITVNSALMRIRARRRRPEALLDGGELAAVAETSGKVEWTFLGPDALDRRELRDGIRACLDRLPDDFRTVIRLRDIEGLDLAEVGRLLDLPLTTVKSRLRRGRAAVRCAIEAHWGTVRP